MPSAEPAPVSAPKRMLQRASNLLTSKGQPSAALRQAGFVPAEHHEHEPRKHKRSLSETNIGASIKRYVSLSRPKSKRTSKSPVRPQLQQFSSAPGSATSERTSFKPPTRAHTMSSLQLPTVQEPPPAPPAEIEELKVPTLLQQGTPMHKVSEKNVKERTFRLDPDQGLILWQSKKSGIIAIENIKEIRVGEDARYYREMFKQPPETEERWLTIVYITDGKYKTLHLIAETRDSFRMWDTTLRKLYALRQELMSGLGNLEHRQLLWERHYWKGADEGGDQKLEYWEVERMCRRLNIYAPKEELMKRFKDADVENRGYLDFTAFQRFVKLLRARPEVNRLYKKLCANGPFDFPVFEKFMIETQGSTLSRPELQALFTKFASPVNVEKAIPPSPAASTTGLVPGMPSSAVKVHDHSVKGFFKHAFGRSHHETKPKPAGSPRSLTPVPPPPPPPPGDTDGPGPTLSLNEFTAFLMSSDNSPFADHHSKIWQDMTRPLSEYYISSSHNTYLVGHQLVGVSTIEGYIRALLHGCRSVEIDIYDGDQEPVIYHGRTLTSKVSLRDVCQAIAKYAFVASPYPIIISAEVHCSLSQQDMVADIMKSVFGEMLVTAPVEAHTGKDKLPSPEDLRHRVLLKAKNLYVSEQAGLQEKSLSLDTESSSTETSSSDEATKRGGGSLSFVSRVRGKLPSGPSSPPKDAVSPKPPSARRGSTKEEKPKVRMSFALVGLLVYTVGVKCRGINKKEHYAIEHVFSLSERTANKILKQGMTDLIKHNRDHVVRIYPNGTRLSSSNYEPHRYWAAGAQVVAINWQTFDLGYMINHAMFQRNGGAGYILKPLALRNCDKVLLSKRTSHVLDVTIISAQQLPRAKDEAGREIITKSILDPFVQVSVHVPDWTHSPFESTPPGSDITLQPAGSPGPPVVTSSAPRTISYRTGVVKNNGFNPVWEEKLSIPFDCTGDMKDLIFVRFEVKDEDGSENHGLALYCISLGSLRQGYRHLPLHDQQVSQYLFSTLFIHVAIRDID